MGRLISADDVKKMIPDTYKKEKDVINSYWKMGTLVDKIDEIQTAYDVDKVLEQFEDATAIGADCVGNAFECIPKYMAIEIVKAGGIDGNT